MSFHVKNHLLTLPAFLSGRNNLPYRPFRRRRPFHQVSLLKTKDQWRPSPPLARLSHDKLWWNSVSRSPHCSPRSTRKWLHVRKGCLPRRHLFQIRKLLPTSLVRWRWAATALPSRTRKPDAGVDEQRLQRQRGSEEERLPFYMGKRLDCAGGVERCGLRE